MLASFGLILILTLVLTLTSRGRAVAQETRECIKICDDAPLSTVVKNILSVIGEVKISNDSESPIPARVTGPIQIASSPGNAVRTKAGLQVTDTFQREVKITLEPNDYISTTTFNVPQSRLLVIEGWGGFAQMGHPVQYPGSISGRLRTAPRLICLCSLSLGAVAGYYRIWARASRPMPIPTARLRLASRATVQ